MSGLDDMSTQDVFNYFKEYPPAHIEWIDDTSCKFNNFKNQNRQLSFTSYIIVITNNISHCYHAFVCSTGNVVWLDDITSTRALINMSCMPERNISNSASSKTTATTVQERRGQSCHSGIYCVNSWDAFVQRMYVPINSWVILRIFQRMQSKDMKSG